MNYRQILFDFRDWMARKGYQVNTLTSEFTIQHRLAVFLDAYLHKKYDCELEVSVEKYGLSKFTKKEIDIVVSSLDERHAIELKFARDQGSFNIAMYKICEDVRFLEQIKDNGFTSVCVYAFTTLPDIYSPTNKEPNPKHPENFPLYDQFRNKKQLQGTIAIKTGSLDTQVTFSRVHSFQWIDFADLTKATWIAE